MTLQPNGRGPGEELYVPTLTATTTNPSLGTGGTAQGGWQPIGSLVWWWAEFVFGTSPDAGSGFYIVSLPKAPVAEPSRAVGDGILLDLSATATGELRIVRAACATTLATALGVDTSSAFLFDVSAPGDTLEALVTDAAPFTWAAGDKISLSGIYQPV